MSINKALRIGLVEDDPVLARHMRNFLQNEDFICEWFEGVSDFEIAFRREGFDFVLLDWNLPDGTGIEIVSWLRNVAKSDVPAFFLTSRTAGEDIVNALESGADDYLSKPIDYAELIARIKALLRRTQASHNTDQVEFKPYTFDTVTHEVYLDGVKLDLTDKEYEFAFLLFINAGRVISRSKLLSAVWGISDIVNTRTVDTHASRLRKKMKLRGSKYWKLSSIYQHGYRLVSLLEEKDQRDPQGEHLHLDEYTENAERQAAQA